MSKAEEIKIPNIGDFKDVEVIEIVVKVGETISTGQPLLVVETDKASMEIPSSHGGLVSELKITVGDRVSEGMVIGLIQAGPAQADAMPAVSSVSESPRPVTDVLVDKKPEALEPVEAEPSKPHPMTTEQRAVASNPGIYPYASPSVRKLGRELGIDLSAITGSGPKSRISKEDIHAYVRELAIAKRGKNGGVGLELAAWPTVDFAQFGEIDRQKLSRIKKLSGASLHRNWVTIPHVTNHAEADITDLEQFRIVENNTGSKPKLTLLSLVMKAVVVALKQHPIFNSSLDGEELVLKKYYNIGFAVDTPGGLVVPVIRGVDRLSIREIAAQMSELSEKARAGKLSSDDMKGGTFTISSLGGIGGSYFTPIINAPEVSILGLGRAVERLALRNGEIIQRLELPLSLSWDHRAIDGADAGRFNATVCRLLGDFRRVAL
ncbi:2-oxo acid dehydrogenase subunit E2 [Pseudomonas fluorescens]|uniref:2-oxo acid dehydrogenase subunit E2 n=1 Tax=Pseudomonas fluorescens TaxID=294 RepID=UPI001784AAD8|nr:2-oxo acid dehydrogenase subunit E2 [Pseudomonas fluorescens]MBD8146742.1 2-oxo acid dehydrogenase subunit E2 [Pseudomonas fluorescens]MBD8175186.1 2-oxo acid dehydrogenase subunit E2 [Pseudomonas fluorescens]MBD8743642.1 2-oxo acid dehydrogenase subunit E2 [Pseudomonas fluorescens]MBD8753467.1 2-oxo acid dehydrogenase subunit E2 [Pseudomonas fluorescens]MBD8759558.1 2-oxo acid dehydrogenase subunit E2 [Pseudomonas fluorescens]